MEEYCQTSTFILPCIVCYDCNDARWFAVFLYAVSLVISIIWLPESIPSVIEKNDLRKTFKNVNGKNYMWWMNSRKECVSH